MRFKIQLKIEGASKKLPINYQYELMSAVYSLLANADKNYATNLHETGYQTDNKRFKLFCFSELIGPNKGISYNKQTGRLRVNGEYVYWQISFMLEDGLRTFVQGLFNNQTIRIADKQGGVTFKIVEIQMMPTSEWRPEPIACTTMSSICVSRKCEGKSTVAYLSPSDEGYNEALLCGLLERYKAIYGKEYSGERYCNLTVVGDEPKSKLITIKAGTPQETRVKGYKFSFNIELPEELFDIAYNCGLGEKCGMGFGMIRIIDKTE